MAESDYGLPMPMSTTAENHEEAERKFINHIKKTCQLDDAGVKELVTYKIYRFPDQIEEIS